MTPSPGTVGLGGAALGNLYDAISDADAVETVLAAWERGVRLFDTAPLYGHGLSELRLGRALQSLPRDELVICTKVGRVLVPDDSRSGDSLFVEVPPMRPELDFTPAGVERSLLDSLERLGTDRLDVVHVHDPDDHLEQAISETYPALARWRDDGVCGAIGLGTNHAATAHAVLDRVELDWLLLAGRYTLLDRSGQSVLDRCGTLGVPVLAAGVFNSGLLADPVVGARYHYAPAPDEVVQRARQLDRLCDGHGVPLAAAALQFPLRHPAVTMILPGARSAGEVHADLDLLAVEVPEALWAEIEQVVDAR